MKHYILLPVILFFSSQIGAQIDFDISEYEFGQDSIISMAVGDPDNNLRDDIFITVDGKNFVYKLQNGLNGFTNTVYLLKDKPELFSIISLNGGDDIIYTEKGKSNLNVLYGKDEYYSEKGVAGTLKLDSTIIIKSIGAVNPVEYIYFNILFYAVDQKDSFHLYSSSASSFNSINALYLNSVPTDFSVGQSCGYYYSSSRATRIFVPDQTNGQLKAMFKDWNFGSNIPIASNMEVIDSKLEKPVACLTVTSKDKGDVMFVLDASKSAIYKYHLLENNKRDEFLFDFINPTQFAAGFVDDNDLVDILVLDGNKLWLVTDLHEGRSGITQTLLVEESGPIKNLNVFDFNNDGFADIIYNIQGGNKIMVLKNDLVSSVSNEQKTQWSIKPNPTKEFIQIDGEYDDLKIVDIKGNEVRFTSDGKTIFLGSIPKGNYVVKLGYKGQYKSKMLLVE